MKRLVLPAVIVPLLMAPGCPEHKFEVVMQTSPDGKVQRELTVWTSEDSNINPPTEDVLAVAQAAYGGDGVAVDGKQRFVGSFERDLPADLVHDGMKNHGFVSVAESRMGSVHSYVERMPGEADLGALFRRAEEIADTLARVMDAGLRERLAADVDQEKLSYLSAFLTKEFRDDVLNGLLIGWQAVVRGSTIEDLRGDPSKDDGGEGGREEKFWMGEMARFVAFGVQRGYLTPDLTLLDDDEMPVALARGFVRKAAAAMRFTPDAQLPEALAGLADTDALNEVFQNGLKAIGVTSEQFDAMLEPAMPDLFGGGTNGDFVWKCGSQPVITNGDYDADAGEIRWYAVGRKGCAPPQILFASWVEANEAFQRAHLGTAALTGDALAQYISWRAGLNQAEQSQWDEFVSSLAPGEELENKLRAFSFQSADTAASAPSEQSSQGEQQNASVQGAAMILKALGLGED